jgi:hypothetical protein
VKCAVNAMKKSLKAMTKGTAMIKKMCVAGVTIAVIELITIPLGIYMHFKCVFCY